MYWSNIKSLDNLSNFLTATRAFIILFENMLATQAEALVTAWDTDCLDWLVHTDNTLLFWHRSVSQLDGFWLLKFDRRDVERSIFVIDYGLFNF